MAKAVTLRFGQFLLALVWLTRLPVWRFVPQPAPKLAAAAWAFPLVGAVVGACAALIWALVQGLGLSSSLAAIFAIAAMVLLTGALHEDGLADLADGFGGQDRVQKLAIMRDSRIGSYGVLAMFLIGAVRIAALADLGICAGALALIAVGSASRSAMTVALHLMPQARADGLGHGAGRPSVNGAVLAALIGTAALLLSVIGQPGGFAVWIICLAVMILAQGVLAWRAQRVLGGQTGDVLGALQQVGEAAGLAALSAMLS